jgi:Transglutaminase-like superfamily
MRGTRIPLAGFLLSFAVAALSGVLLLFSIEDARDLVHIRNSLLLTIGPSTAFDWTPANVPHDFQSETLAVPQELQAAADAAVASLPADATAFDKAIALSRHLVRVSKGAGPIQQDTVTSYRKITQEGLGYCADYTQVFNALARAASLPVREWGAAFGGYGGDGHAFNEIYDAASGRWIFVDSFYSFYVTQKGRALSAMEFRDELLRPKAERTAEVVPIDPEHFGFKSAERALDYYARAAPEFYLWWGNNVLTYDASPVLQRLSRMSRSAEQVGAVLVGLQPKLVVAEGTGSPGGLAKLQRTRVLLLTSLMAGMAAAVFLVWYLIARRRAG